jgi:dihydrofolate reductase
MRVVVHEFISLDGVVQGPGKPGGLGEDTNGGFRHGGWSVPYNNSEVWVAINQFAERSGAVLLGRSTYQSGAAVWPTRPGPFADWINRTQKYVVSGTLSGSDDTPWKPTTIIRGADLLNEVARLRDRPGDDIYVYGSLRVVRALLAAGLVDELVLMVEPITLGGGTSLFPIDGEARVFKLISATTTGTGVQVCRYHRL